MNAAAATSPWERALEWLRSNVAPPLRALEEPLDRLLSAIPMHVAQALVIGFFLIVTLWVWTLRREYIYLGAPDRAGWRDLRVWATLLVVPYIAVYYWLGR